MSLSNPNTLVSKERLHEFYKGLVPYLGGLPVKTTLSQTLTAGDTSVTFDVSSFDENCIINFHTSRGYEYTSMTQNNGIITLTYSPTIFDLVVLCEITEVSE